MDNMLRKALRKYRELRNQFENCLLGEDGDMWETEAKKFLAKRSCWTKPQVGVPAPEPSLIIDCDVDPFLPAGLQVEEHKPGGQFRWDPTKINLYLSPNQQDGKSIEGHKLRIELANQSVMNANLLDYLLAHPYLIPEDWKQDADGNTRFIYFWGTVYRDSGRDLCVRYLCWSDGHWQAHCNWLGSGWHVRYPAARLAN